jgi:hypothetical protein
MPSQTATKPKLLKGTGNVRANVTTLMAPARSPSRKKAIITIAKKNNISRSDAQFKQAVAIAKRVGRLK